jgi:hypothetical protein
MMRVPIPLPSIQVPGGLVLSYSDKAEFLTGNLEAQFQLVDDPSDPKFTKIVK